MMMSSSKQLYKVRIWRRSRLKITDLRGAMCQGRYTMNMSSEDTNEYVRDWIPPPPAHPLPINQGRKMRGERQRRKYAWESTIKMFKSTRKASNLAIAILFWMPHVEQWVDLLSFNWSSPIDFPLCKQAYAPQLTHPWWILIDCR